MGKVKLFEDVFILDRKFDPEGRVRNNHIEVCYGVMIAERILVNAKCAGEPRTEVCRPFMRRKE